MLKVIKGKENVVIFDLEATCEAREKAVNYDNELIEIGAVKVDSEGIVDSLDIYVKPSRTVVTEFCTELTGITSDKLDQEGISYEEALNKFKDFCKGSEQILSWGYYDRKQIEKDSKINGYELGNLFKNHESLKHEHGKLVGKRAMGVQKALKKHGLTFKGHHHNGYDDAVNIASIYKEVQKLLKEKTQ